MKEVENKAKQISWQLINAFRGTLDTNDAFGVILYLLYLKDDDFLFSDLYSKISQTDSITQHEIASIIISANKSEESVLLLQSISESKFYIVPPQVFRSSCKIISDIDSPTYSRLFPLIIDSLISTLISVGSRRGGEWFQPWELTKLVVSLADVQPNHSVYNPFAGTASYGIAIAECLGSRNPEFRNSFIYRAEEYNNRIWAAGKIRLLANNIPSSNYLNCNSIESLNNEPSHNYDIILSTPPFGVRINEQINEGYKGARIESFFLENSVNQLTDKGKTIAVIPMGILNSMNKKHLIDSDLIETILILPENAFAPYTGIQTVIVVLNRKKEEWIKNRIRIVNASLSYSTIGKEIIIDTASIQKMLVRHETSTCKIIPNGSFANNDYLLNPLTYFIKEVEIPNGYISTPLSEVLTICHGEKFDYQDQANYVSVKEMAVNLDSFDKQSYEMPLRDVDRRKYNKYTRDILVIAPMFGKLKPTYIHASESNPIYVGKGFFCFIINTDVIIPSYIFHALNSEYTQPRIDALRKGSSITHISIKDFLSVDILIPPIGVQKELIVSLSSSSQEMIKAFSINNKEFEDYKESVRVKKHNISQYFPGIFSNLKTMKKVINDYSEQFGKQLMYSEDVSLEEKIESIHTRIKSLSRIISTLSDENLFGEGAVCDIEKVITEFIRDNQYEGFNIYFNVEESDRIIRNNEFIEEYQIEESDFDKKKDVPFYSFFCKKDLKSCLSNLIQNARDHGFKNKKDDNVITISIERSDDDRMTIISVSNNGELPPDGFTKEQLFKRGFTTSSGDNRGLGGNYVLNFAKCFSGDVDLSIIHKPENIFTVSISLPTIIKQ